MMEERRKKERRKEYEPESEEEKRLERIKQALEDWDQQRRSEIERKVRQLVETSFPSLSLPCPLPLSPPLIHSSKLSSSSSSSLSSLPSFWIPSESLPFVVCLVLSLLYFSYLL